MNGRGRRHTRRDTKVSSFKVFREADGVGLRAYVYGRVRVYAFVCGCVGLYGCVCVLSFILCVFFFFVGVFCVCLFVFACMYLSV